MYDSNNYEYLPWAFGNSSTSFTTVDFPESGNLLEYITASSYEVGDYAKYTFYLNPSRLMKSGEKIEIIYPSEVKLNYYFSCTLTEMNDD